MMIKPFRGIQLNKSHPLARGLVGCWLMNEGSGSKVHDYSGNDKKGTLQNMEETDWVAGMDGGCLYFDGSDEYIHIPNYSSSNNKAVSLFAWVKPRSFADFEGVVSNLKEEVPYPGYALYTHGDGTVGTYLGAHRRSSNSLSQDIWSYIGFTYVNGSLKLYINKDLVRTDTLIAYVGSDALRIANFYVNSELPARIFNGHINNVVVYNRALSPDEIRWLYSEPYAMFEPALPIEIMYVPIVGWPHTVLGIQAPDEFLGLAGSDIDEIIGI